MAQLGLLSSAPCSTGCTGRRRLLGYPRPMQPKALASCLADPRRPAGKVTHGGANSTGGSRRALRTFPQLRNLLSILHMANPTHSWPSRALFPFP